MSAEGDAGGLQQSAKRPHVVCGIGPEQRVAQTKQRDGDAAVHILHKSPYHARAIVEEDDGLGRQTRAGVLGECQPFNAAGGGGGVRQRLREPLLLDAHPSLPMLATASRSTKTQLPPMRTMLRA